MREDAMSDPGCHWNEKSKLPWLNKLPSHILATTSPCSCCPTTAWLYHPVVLNGPLHGSQFYDPVFSNQGSTYRSPSKSLSHTGVTSALLRALELSSKRRLYVCIPFFASLLLRTCWLVGLFRKGVRPQRQVGNYLTLNWTHHLLP